MPSCGTSPCSVKRSNTLVRTNTSGLWLGASPSPCGTGSCTVAGLPIFRSCWTHCGRPADLDRSTQARSCRPVLTMRRGQTGGLFPPSSSGLRWSDTIADRCTPRRHTSGATGRNLRQLALESQGGSDNACNPSESRLVQVPPRTRSLFIRWFSARSGDHRIFGPTLMTTCSSLAS